MSDNILKFILIILDGFGLRDEKEGNAYALANTPILDSLFNTSPCSSIETSGEYVGLPDGIMGNSEVGHMNIGAGRIVKQDLVRINNDIENDEMVNNENLLSCFEYVNENNSRLHFMGLLSDGGVHSHIDHLKHLLRLAKLTGVKESFIHVITDGRDTSPDSGLGYLKDLQNYIDSIEYGEIVSVCGRYYAMDRDKRWERTELACALYLNGEGEKFNDFKKMISKSYKDNIYDEFITPKIKNENATIKDDDGLIAFNFRADRMRQIMSAFTDEKFDSFKVNQKEISVVSMTKYEDKFSFPVLYAPVQLNNILGEILSNNSINQLRAAETEKYAHVTYFFNGGKEKEFDGEDRLLIPSPKVATYDLQPEMNAIPLTEKVVERIKINKYGAIIMNYANPDMVGHTGNIEAAVKAIETVDYCLEKIISSTTSPILITADHGNLEMMINPDTGKVHTAHTTLPVPLLLVSSDDMFDLKEEGKLADIAPTILDMLSIELPPEMSGSSLLIRKK